MDNRHGKLRLGALVPLLAACVVLAGCGGGGDSSNAASLLRQTFSGSHKVNSGTLQVALTITPSGSRTFTGPVSLTFGGPFQSEGSGKLPASNFTVSLSALGSSTSIGILSTGQSGYVTFEGSSYQLPQASFQRLEASFSQLTASPGSGHSSVLGRLGIQPLHWLSSPHVIGSESVGGVSTTHISAGVNVSALLGDLSTFLQKASSLGVSSSTGFSSGLPAALVSKIAGEIQNPTFDVWTGNSDKTLRKLQIHLTLPVTGQTSTLLGGLRSAGVSLSMSYGSLNQPQTISAPTNVAPYSQFQSKLQTFISGIRGELTNVLGGLGSSGSLGGSTGATGPTGSTGSSSSGTSGKYGAYSKCIQAANGSVAKMQKCAPLLNSGG
jgi:hypothetical protein